MLIRVSSLGLSALEGRAGPAVRAIVFSGPDYPLLGHFMILGF